VTLPPDFDRIAELARRLDEIRREAEEIRARIDSSRGDVPPWPDRRRESRMFEREESGGVPRKPEPT
jgi:hypothetical protein